MKVKNLVLFGFILSAISYLSKQIEEENDDEQKFFSELEDIDLQQVKDELGSKLEKAIVEFGDVVGSIAKIGSDAFDKFLNDASEDLEKEEYVEKLKEAIAFKEEKDNVENDALEVSSTTFDDLLNVIEEAVADEVEEVQEEDKAEEVQEEAAEEEPSEEESLWHNASFNYDDLIQDLKDTLNSFDLGEDETKEEVVEEPEPIVEEEVETEDISEEANDVYNIVKEAASKPNEEKEIEDLFEDLLVDTKVKAQKEVDKDEIDAIFQEILDQENGEEEKEEEAEAETEEVQDEEDYLQDLIDDMQEEIEAEQEEEAKPDIYDQINELYPYLTKNFVRSVYDLKQTIADEYPYDKDVIVLHRVSFNNLEDLQQFVEIVTNHNYGVNVDEKKMIVDLFKLYRNSDGKILTNIFEIANQARLLHGEYEGYRVEVEE